MKDINTALGAIFLVALIGLPIALWQAYCLTILWGWYAPPVWGFVLTMKDAIGLALIVGLLRMKAAGKNEPDLADRISMAIIGPALTLGFGWILLLVVR